MFTSSHSQLLKVLSFEQLGEVEILGVVAEVLEQRLEGGSVLGPVGPALQHHAVVVIVWYRRYKLQKKWLSHLRLEPDLNNIGVKVLDTTPTKELHLVTSFTTGIHLKVGLGLREISAWPYLAVA